MSKRLRPGYQVNKDAAWHKLFASSAPCASCAATPARTFHDADRQADVCMVCHRDPRLVKRALLNSEAGPRLTAAGKRVLALEDKLKATELSLKEMAADHRRLAQLINAMVSDAPDSKFDDEQNFHRGEVRAALERAGWSSPEDVAKMREAVQVKHGVALYPLGPPRGEDAPSPTGRG